MCTGLTLLCYNGGQTLKNKFKPVTRGAGSVVKKGRSSNGGGRGQDEGYKLNKAPVAVVAAAAVVGIVVVWYRGIMLTPYTTCVYKARSL